MQYLLYAFALGAVLLIARFTAALLRRYAGVGYVSSIRWGFRHRRTVLAAACPLLLLLSSLGIFASLHVHYVLLFGSVKDVVALGRTSDHILFLDPRDEEAGLGEQQAILTSFSSPNLYPGQTFPEAVEGLVLIRPPLGGPYDVLQPSVFAYAMVNLTVLVILAGSVFANGWLMVHHAADAGVLESVPSKGEMPAHFRERMGLSLGRAILLVCGFFAASAIFDGVVVRKYDPAFDAAARKEKRYEEELLSRVRPGMTLEGTVVGEDVFLVERDVHRASDRHRSDRDTVTIRHLAYLVRFEGLLPQPVFLNMVYREDESRPALRKQMTRLDGLAKSGARGAFTVQEDYSLLRAIEKQDP